MEIAINNPQFFPQAGGLARKIIFALGDGIFEGIKGSGLDRQRPRKSGAF
jgi:hypothetical protein